MCDEDEFRKMEKQMAGLFARIEELAKQQAVLASQQSSMNNDMNTTASKMITEINLLKQQVENMAKNEDAMLESYRAIAGFVKVSKWLGGIVLFVAALFASLKTGLHIGGK